MPRLFLTKLSAPSEPIKYVELKLDFSLVELFITSKLFISSNASRELTYEPN